MYSEDLLQENLSVGMCSKEMLIDTGILNVQLGDSLLRMAIDNLGRLDLII